MRRAKISWVLWCGALALACPSPDPAAECRVACEKVTACGLGALAEAMDCKGGCLAPRTFKECASCLAGTRPSCEQIATARTCGSSCRVRPQAAPPSETPRAQ